MHRFYACLCIEKKMDKKKMEFSQKKVFEINFSTFLRISRYPQNQKIDLFFYFQKKKHTIEKKNNA
jgi:hypothetical protein